MLRCLLFSFLLSSVFTSAQDVADRVNPWIGTDSRYELSNGNTYPAIALPWGNHAWTPQTNTMGNGWIYQYSALKINGIRLTHQPSPWINDYGAFAFMPVIGKPVFSEKERASWFSHKTETVRPYYYQTYLASADTWLELCPTNHGAIIRMRVPADTSVYLVWDAFDRGSSVSVDQLSSTIQGYSSNNSGGVPANFRNHFVAQLNVPIDSVWMVDAGRFSSGASTVTSNHAGAVLKLRVPANRIVEIRVAASFISTEMAWLHLQRDLLKRSFETVRDVAKRQWNQVLGRIRVSGGSADQQAVFYTALYRTLLFPRAVHELNDHGVWMHYSPYNGRIEPGYLYTDNGFWDTFRAVFPLFALVYPEQSSEIMQGLANTYRESGWLPEWASPGHRDCMIGSHSASIIADAYLKGVRGFPIKLLYEAIKKNTWLEGPLGSVGRKGVDWYNQLGYIPSDVGINEQAARTLEYAYDDFTIFQLARALGKPKAEQDTFAQRALNYRNLWDSSTGFMRGRRQDGSWQTPFRPDAWGGSFTEGNAWHWTWSVFHDPAGLIRLMGSPEAFVAKLDAVFTSPPTFDYTYYGQQIHEITEMLIAGMGQYAHGNQPIQHMPYLYAYANQPWKTQYWVRQIMDRLYRNSPDGLCGDEDNGQTSAWLVFSALGFYPVCPGSGEYVLGSPWFNRAEIQLPHQKRVVIDVRQQGRDAHYIQSMLVNGKSYTKNFIRHEELIRGMHIDMRLSSQPNKRRGVFRSDLPFSFSR